MENKSSKILRTRHSRFGGTLALSQKTILGNVTKNNCENLAVGVIYKKPQLSELKDFIKINIDVNNVSNELDLTKLNIKKTKKQFQPYENENLDEKIELNLCLNKYIQDLFGEFIEKYFLKYFDNVSVI